MPRPRRRCDAEIERLKKEPVTRGGTGRRETARARRADQRAGRQLQLANSLADWQALTGDWRNLFRDLEQLEAVTPADIQRVAKEIFTVNNRTIATIEPLAAEKKVQMMRRLQPHSFAGLRSRPRRPASRRLFKDLKFGEPGRIRVPEPVRFQLPNGMTVLLVEDHELPTINVSAHDPRRLTLGAGGEDSASRRSPAP